MTSSNLPGAESVAVPNAPRTYDDDALSQITSFDAAMDAATSGAGGVESFSDYGNGFDILDDKQQLVGVPFLLLDWRFNVGDMGDFVSATLVTKDGRRFILNDGSTGILKQLNAVSAKRIREDHPKPQAHLLVEKGLRVSEYTYYDTDKKTGEQVSRPAKTYYLAN